ncbi:DUF6684 family protein [Natronoarchaeum rubrum]|uniref:DUF6684 family protein n=1 Tax=Natronoarchaeum rubrum TaxID=755311 RepID=UPI0021123EC3|nr:DUF6684 family protein [Natronoarchaeum rubrum]HMB50676.1 DUF6684 family protein [Natronoarchaeum rubrum]
MVEQPLDRETLLDIIVNAVPFAILVIFILLFTIVTPWGPRFGEENTLPTLIMYGHLLFTTLVLVVVTYVSAKYISRDEP